MRTEMTETEKQQIEEMAEIITSADPHVNCKGQSCLTCEFNNIEKNCYTAKALYNAGYHKPRSGEWVFNRGRTYGEPAYYCSECSEGTSEDGHDNFCPNCGAHMRGCKNE